MLDTLGNIGRHMIETHPNIKYFGDTIIEKNGKVTSQKCQICGEELIKYKTNYGIITRINIMNKGNEEGLNSIYEIDYTQMSNKEFIENLRISAFQHAKISVENFRRRENNLFSEEELEEVRNIEILSVSMMLERVKLKGEDMEGAVKEFLHKFDDPNL